MPKRKPPTHNERLHALLNNIGDAPCLAGDDVDGEDEIGDLAYLCHAIADRERGAHVDWSDELRGMAGVEGETLRRFREWFPRRHVVWRFIRG